MASPNLDDLNLVTRDTDSFNIYLSDTGLFVTLAFWDRDISDDIIYSKIFGDKLSVDLGYVFENLSAQMIRAAGRTLYYYTWPQREDLKKHYEKASSLYFRPWY